MSEREKVRVKPVHILAQLACMFTTMLLLEWANPVDFGDSWALVGWGASRAGLGCGLGWAALADRYGIEPDHDPDDLAKRKKMAKTAWTAIVAIAVAAAIRALA